jgi:uncharacterized small protein (DUF1192 family)
MDWDEVRTPVTKAIATGEPLAALSIAELEGRIVIFEAEIARLRSEIAAKRRQAEAANAFFK